MELWIFFFEACSINQWIRNKQMINKALGIGMHMQAGRRKGSRGERGRVQHLLQVNVE